jgi:hypothetical protein
MGGGGGILLGKMISRYLPSREGGGLGGQHPVDEREMDSFLGKGNVYKHNIAGVEMERGMLLVAAFIRRSKQKKTLPKLPAIRVQMFTDDILCSFSSPGYFTHDRFQGISAENSDLR